MKIGTQRMSWYIPVKLLQRLVNEWKIIDYQDMEVAFHDRDSSPCDVNISAHSQAFSSYYLLLNRAELEKKMSRKTILSIKLVFNCLTITELNRSANCSENVALFFVRKLKCWSGIEAEKWRENWFRAVESFEDTKIGTTTFPYSRSHFRAIRKISVFK